MFAGFNVHISGEEKDFYREYYDVGIDLYEDQKSVVSISLEKYIRPKGVLSNELISKDWFPEVNAHVFLSHSHKDIDFVISFAGWLKEEFKIISFIDSCIWGNSDELLRSIDNEYCVSKKDESGNIETYDYRKRNKSTSNVHMMLNTALIKMIDRTECLMFINTPQSVSWNDCIREKTATLSPWIYAELFTSSIIRNRSRESHRRLLKKSFQHGVVVENATDYDIEYVIKTKHLVDLYDSDLTWFKDFYDGHGAFDALDYLYRNNDIDLDEGIING